MISKIKIPVLLFVVSLLPLLTTCSQTSSTSALSVVDNRPKLIVYVVGFGEELTVDDVAKNFNYGYEHTFYQLKEGHNLAGGVQPYLSSHMQNVTSMVYSYMGSNSDGSPKPFSCADTYNMSLVEDVQRMQAQINGYLQVLSHKNTEVFLVGHSLGGLIAFSYVAKTIEDSHSNALVNGGTLKGIATLDSPLNGVTRANGYQTILIWLSKGCRQDLLHSFEKDYTIVSQMQTLGETGAFTASKTSILGAIFPSKFISNQKAAEDAANLGVNVLIVGNSSDTLWQPNLCFIGPNFLSTQYLSERGPTGKGALYVRSFSGNNGLIGGCLSAAPSHFAVVTNPGVQQVILEVFTRQRLDQLASVTDKSVPSGTLHPTPSPDFGQFVGTWKYYGSGMQITSDQRAVYQGRTWVWCDNDSRQPCDSQENMAGLNTTIQFSSVEGKTAAGIITGGTGDRNLRGNTIIPVGGTISITLTDQSHLTVSDGRVMVDCQNLPNAMECVSNT